MHTSLLRNIVGHCVQDASLAATASGIGSVEAGHAAVVRSELYAVRLHCVAQAGLAACFDSY